MSVELESAARLNALKQGIEAKTGETYPDLTGGVNALIAGFGQGGGGSGGYTDGQIKAWRIVSRVESGHLNLDDAWGTNEKIPDNYAYNNTCVESLYWSAVSGLNLGIGNRAFYECTKLISVDFPNLLYWHYGNVFNGCTALKTVNIPSFANKLQTGAFQRCSALQHIDLAHTTSILNNAFSEASSLNSVVLRNEAVVAIANLNVFYKTPFAVGGSGGTVYVPEALIESYKTATNWVTLYDAGTCNFVAIEGSEYE